MADLYVGSGQGQYATIQAAINAASQGDTIHVSAGSYAENLSINKGLTFVGANTGKAGADETRGAETLIHWSSGDAAGVSTTAQVTFDGFRFEGSEVLQANGGGANVTFENSTFDLTSAWGSNNFYLNDPAHFTFRDNLVDVAGDSGAVFQPVRNAGTPSELVVTFDHNVFNGPADPEHTGPVILNLSGVSGTVTDNTFSGVDIGVLVADSTGPLEISDNEFTNMHRPEGEGLAAGVALFEPGPYSGTITIADNSFTDVDSGIRTSSAGPATPPTLTGSTISIDGNSFTDVGLPGNVSFTGQGLHFTDSTVDGASVANLFVGGTDDDSFTDDPGAGERFMGGAGTDEVSYGADHSVGFSDGHWTVVGNDTLDPTDTLAGIERVVIDGATYLLVDTLGGAGGFTSLADALAAADAGDTILLADGTYAAANLTIGESVTIQGVATVEGADPGAIIDGTGAGTGVSITADDVTLRNLSIHDYSVGVELSADGTRIEDVTFDGNVTAIRKGTAAEVTGFTMTGGTIRNGTSGIHTFAASNGDGTFSDVEISGVSLSDLRYKGFYFEQLSDATISDISMDNVGYYGDDLGKFGNGIDINLKYGDYSDITIENFTFTDVGDSTGDGTTPHEGGGAIAIKARDDASSYNTNPATLENVVIRNGSIDGINTAIRIGEPGKLNAGPEGVEVENVTISGAESGELDNRTSSPLTVTGTDGGDHLTPYASATGTFSLSGGGGDDTLTGGDGDDTLDGGAGSNLIQGGEGHDVALYEGPITVTASGGSQIVTHAGGVDTVSGVEQIGNYRFVAAGESIQAAVDAASDGDTIILAAGTYREQVDISDKALTIVGAGVGQTIIEAPDTADLTPSGDTAYRAVVTVEDGANVSLAGVTVDGRAQGALSTGTDQLAGVLVLDSDASIDGIRVTNIREIQGGVTSGNQRNDAIVAISDAAEHTVTVQNSSVDLYQKNGIHASGDALTVHLLNNTIGTAGDLWEAQTPNGIRLVDGAQGTIVGNHILDIGHTGTANLPVTGYPNAIELNGAGPGVLVQNNTVDGIGHTSVGLAVVNSDAVAASGNSFTDVVSGIYQAGSFTTPVAAAANSYTNVQVATYLDAAAGPLAGTAFSGSLGPDVLNGGNGADTLNGAEGADTIAGGNGADELYGSQGDDVVYGFAGADLIYGGQGNDRLDGGEGDDTIAGGGGADLIAASTGADSISGGAAIDTLAVAPASAPAGSGTVLFSDFENGERIDLSAFAGVSEGTSVDSLGQGQYLIAPTENGAVVAIGLDTVAGADLQVTLVAGHALDGTLSDKVLTFDGQPDPGDPVYSDYVFSWAPRGIAALAQGTADGFSDPVLVTSPGGRTWELAGTGDFDGDGDDDLVWWTVEDGGGAAVSLMQGTSVASTVWVGAPDAGFTLVEVKDVDANGDDELVWRSADGTIAAVSGADTASFDDSEIGDQWSFAGIGNVDGTGNRLVWTSAAAGGIAVSSAGSSASTFYGAAVGTGWKVVDISDLGGDAREDVVMTNADGTQVTVTAFTAGPGGTVAVSNAIGSPAAGWTYGGVGDFGGTNHGILWLSPDGTEAQITQLQLAGTGGLVSGGSTAIGGPGAGYELAGIFNADGIGTDEILWHRPDGYALQTDPLDFGQGSQWIGDVVTTDDWRSGLPGSLAPGQDSMLAAIGDIDGDGEDDLLWGNSSGASAVTRIVDGEPVEVVPFVIPGYEIAETYNLDADGADEVVWVASDGSSVRIAASDGFSDLSDPISLDGFVYRGIGNFEGKGTQLVWEMADHTGVALSPVDTTDGATWLAADHPGAGWELVKVADFLGDGNADFLWWSETDGIAFTSDPDATDFTEPGTSGTEWFSSPGVGWTYVDSGRLDGDGTIDILWKNADGAIAISSPTLAGGVFVPAQSGVEAWVGGIGLGWTPMKLVDSDGDGIEEVLWHNQSLDAYALQRDASDPGTASWLGQLSDAQVANIDTWRFDHWSFQGPGDFVFA